ISADGNTIVVGAPANNTGGYNASGAVYVFLGVGWPQVAKLENAPNGGLDGNLLGASVAVSANGNTVAAGTPSFGYGGYAGSVSMFVNPGTWVDDDTQDASLTANDGASGDLLGTSVAISADGNTVVAGAPKHNGGVGATYVFINPGTWDYASQDAKLTASDGGGNDELGRAVAISADGNTIVAGAPNKFIGGSGADGAAYVFVNPGTWADANEEAKQTAYYGGNGVYHQLGWAVAASSDASTIIAGARFNDFGRGAVFVFGAPVPVTASITRDSSNPTSANIVLWKVAFNRPVVGLGASNFTLVPGGGVSGASISYWSNADLMTWYVAANTGTGSGTLGLNMTNDDNLIPALTPTPTPASPIVGEVYDINKGAPTATVTAITRANGNPTSLASVSWNVTFSQSVVGLSTSN
ncbi:MAG TPA: FG-GAP repeat protein, partial [Azospirillaceae bacterium]|nr:FG-GAP repeat protein [Azospirillaceae bacterium]